MCRCVFLQPLPHKSLLAKRFQFHCNTIEATCYEPRTLTVTYPGDTGLHSFSMNMLSGEADTFVIWCMRRFEKGETRSKYGVHPSVSKSSELCSVVVGRERERFISFYRVTEKCVKCCPFVNNKDLQSHGQQQFRTSSTSLIFASTIMLAWKSEKLLTSMMENSMLTLHPILSFVPSYLIIMPYPVCRIPDVSSSYCYRVLSSVQFLCIIKQ